MPLIDICTAIIPNVNVFHAADMRFLEAMGYISTRGAAKGFPCSLKANKEKARHARNMTGRIYVVKSMCTTRAAG